MKRLIFAILAAAAISARAADLDIRHIYQTNDVSATRPAVAPLKWFGGESVDLNVYLKRGSAPVDLTGTSMLVRLEAFIGTGTVAYLMETGTISSATNGFCTWTLTPSRANLPVGTYNSFIKCYQSIGGTNVYVGVGVNQDLQVLWGASATNYVYTGPYTNSSETDPIALPALNVHTAQTSTAHGGIPTTNGLASIAYVDAATNGLSTNGLASLGYVNTATQGLVTATITNNVLPLDGSKAMTYYGNGGGYGWTNVPIVGNPLKISANFSLGELLDDSGNCSIMWSQRYLASAAANYTWSSLGFDLSNKNLMQAKGTNFVTVGTLPTHNTTNYLLEGVKIPSSTNADYATWANNSSNLTDSLTNYFRNAANLTNVTSTANTATNGTYLRFNVAGGVTTLTCEVVDYSTVVTGAQSNAISTVQSSNDLNTAAITTQSNRVVSVSNSMAYVSNLVESCIDTQANNTAAISGLQGTQTTYRAFTLHLAGIGTNDTNSMATYWSSAAPYPSHITNIRWWADGTATGNLLRSSYATAPSAWEDVVFSNLTTAAWAWSNYAVNIAITNGEMLNYYMIGCTNNGCDLMGTKD